MMRWMIWMGLMLIAGAATAAAPPGQAITADNEAAARLSSTWGFESLAEPHETKDGVITAREFGAERRDLFLRLDADRDSELTLEEWAEAPLRLDAMSQCALAILIRSDANLDGLLQRREFIGRPAAFVDADRDENNALHFEEVLILANSPKPMIYDPELFLRAHDLDGDRVVDMREWQTIGSTFALWDAIDINADKMLTDQEIESFLWHYERRVAPLFAVDGLE